MLTRHFFLIFIAITFYSCDEKTTTTSSKNCICSDLILDIPYNHVYLNDRTLPFSGTCKEYHKGGGLFKEIEYLEGKMEGTFLEYSKNNILLKKSNFSRNMMHGVAYAYDTSGLLVFHGIYKRGKLETVLFKHQ